MARTSLSLSEARRIALCAQGFDRPRPRRVTARRVADVVRRLGLLQLDYVNVLAPAHFQVLFSRLGPYRRTLLDEVVYRKRDFTEQWAHEASIVPIDLWPLLRHRREAHRPRPWGFDRFLERNPAYVRRALSAVRRRGPLSADDLPAPDGMSPAIPGAWSRSVPRATLEALFGRGVLAIANRRPNFQRVYDLARRVIPAPHRDRRLPRADAERELLRRAARAQGVATLAHLADYYRMSPRDVRPRVAELVSDGDLQEVIVEGWREPGYLSRGSTVPRSVDAVSLLSPFDPLIWHRPRAAQLFGFDYRIEIYVPEARRRWGYYVLPFLLGERLVARLDLKADRARHRLLVIAAHHEPHTRPAIVVGPLARELWTLARWLGLEGIAVGQRGTLAAALAKAI